MNAHADKKKANKFESVSNGMSQVQGIGKPNVQFIDNRREAVAQRKLQEIADNSPRASYVEAFRGITDNHSLFLQENKRLVIQKYSFQERMEYRGWTTHHDFTFVKNGGILYPRKVGDLLIAKGVKHQPSMVAALQYAASRFSDIGNMANRIKVIDGGMANSPNPRNANTMYPFVFAISVPFGKKGSVKTVTLKYQYANNAPGYIIGQEVTGEGVSDMVNVPIVNIAAGFSDTFFSSHGKTDSTKLVNLLEQDPDLPKSENAERLDARTKLAGEGARFNVVKDNMSKISDLTVIYTQNDTHTYFVRFRSLWMNWAGLFNSAYGITNKHLATQLLNPSVWRQDYKPTKIKKGSLAKRDTIKL